MKRGFVYILRSLNSGRFYIGSTADINKRIKRHESGNVKSTRSMIPFKLEIVQECRDVASARKIERKLKSFKRSDFIEKIVQDRCIKLGL